MKTNDITYIFFVKALDLRMKYTTIGVNILQKPTVQ